MAIGGYGNVATSPNILGGTDQTPIGNIADKLKVTDQDVLSQLTLITSGLGISAANIFKQNELAITTRNEIDFTSVTYTVPTSKKFLLNSFIASYDAQATINVRFKKQTGGSGSFVTLLKIVLEVGGQGQSTIPLNFGNGILIGSATDVFKVTIEASLAKGTVWACFTGNEF